MRMLQVLTVQKVTQQRSQKGGTYYKVATDRGAFYVWDAQVAQGLTPGAVVEAEVREGDYPRILSARQVAAPNGNPQSEREGGREERLEALRLAVAIIGQVRPQDVPQVLEAAERIRRWLSDQ